MSKNFDANKFAIASAATAFDQQQEWGGLETSLGVHFDNLRDTLVEYRVIDRSEIASAEEAFWRKAAQLGYTRK